MANLQQAIALSQLSEGKRILHQPKTLSAVELVKIIYELNANEGRDLRPILHPDDYVRKYMPSEEFYLATIPGNKIGAPVNRHAPVNQNLVSRLIAECEKPRPVVVDYNYRRVGKNGKYFPEVLLIDGHESLVAQTRRGEPKILAWVGCEIAAELKVIQADHQLSSNEIQSQLSDLIRKTENVNTRESMVNGKYAYVQEVYPLENYCIYQVNGTQKTDNGSFRQKYTIDNKSRTIALDGQPVKVVQQYVDADEVAASTLGRGSLESAMLRSSTVMKTCKACGELMAECTCKGKDIKSGGPGSGPNPGGGKSESKPFVDIAREVGMARQANRSKEDALRNQGNHEEANKIYSTNKEAVRQLLIKHGITPKDFDKQMKKMSSSLGRRTNVKMVNMFPNGLGD